MKGLLRRRANGDSFEGAETAPDTDIEPPDVDITEAAVEQEDSASGNPPPQDAKPARGSLRIAVFIVLPFVAVAAAGIAAFFKYQAATAAAERSAAVEAVQAASDGAVALLSYHADSVEKDLSAAGDRLTGSFREDYEKLTKDIVIPGAHEKGISAVASVPASATVSATPDHAVVLVFVDQNITVGTDPPTSSSSSVRVTLDKLGGRWMISGFEPV